MEGVQYEEKEKTEMTTTKVSTYVALNDVLVKLFREIMNIEDKAIITPEFKDITNNDMHVIDAIGISEKKNMSSVANALMVTMGSLTSSVNALVLKGYVNRERSSEDRRVVYVGLTDRGKAAYSHHEKFHREMIETISGSMNDEERMLLTEALGKLYSFFRKKQRENAVYRVNA